MTEQPVVCPKCGKKNLMVRLQRVQAVWVLLDRNEKGEFVPDDNAHPLRVGSVEFDENVQCVECPGCKVEFGSLTHEYRAVVRRLSSTIGGGPKA